MNGEKNKKTSDFERYDSGIYKWLKVFFPFVLILFFAETYGDWLKIKFDQHILPWLEIKPGILTNVMFFTLIFFLIYPSCRIWKYKYKVSCNHLIAGGFILFIYGYCRIQYAGSYHFSPEWWGIIGYLDVLAFIFLYYMISLIIAKHTSFTKRKKKKKKQPEAREMKQSDPEKKSENKLIIYREKAIECKDEDKLEFWRDAEKFVDTVIKNIDMGDSYSIGIISDWGMGKTSYAKLIEECLRKEDNKYIIVNYNPSLSKSNDFIQEDFFESLYAKLKKYSLKFTKLFDLYLMAIDAYMDKQNIFQRINKLRDPEKEKEKLDKAIREIGKRIIVFIDDLDRLDKEGILEVLKLIYHNASFTNIIFISLYSKQTIMKTLKVERDMPFSDKYFDREILLPPRTYKDWYSWMLEELNATFPENKIEPEIKYVIDLPDGLRYQEVIPVDVNDLFIEEEPDKSLLKGYGAIISHDISLIEKTLPTPRDIKRFIIAFIEAYKYVHGELNYANYFFLYLLYYRYPHIYDKVKNKFFLHKSIENFYQLSPEKYKEKESYTDILIRLFPKTTIELRGNYRTINKPKYFEAYFRNSLVRYLSVNELKHFFENNQDYLAQLSDWEGKEELSDVIEYAESINYKNLSQENFERYLTILFYTYSLTNNWSLYDKIIFLIHKNKTEIEQQFPGLQLKKIVSNTLKRKEGRYRYNDLIIQWIIDLIKDKDDFKDFLFSLGELQKIAKDNLKDYINEYLDEFSETNMRLLYTCIDSINSHNSEITLDKDACNITFQQIKKNPDYYICSFVRLGSQSSNPQINSIVGEPFYKQIFNDNDTFEKFIMDEKLNELSRITRVRNFWHIYKANGYNPIYFSLEGDVGGKIENDLEPEKGLVNKIDIIEEEYNEIIKEKGAISISRLQELESLRERLKAIPLNIKKKRDLLQKIEEAIRRAKGEI